jgi:exoribonuclease R
LKRLNVLVAITDVDAIVRKRSAIDDHARHNTTSVYTSAMTFPLLPEKLSTGLTSLNVDSDRRAEIVLNFRTRPEKQFNPSGRGTACGRSY